jgi:phosphoribosylamine--glycine ligase
MLASCGLPVLKSFAFPDAEAASTFVREHPGMWVVKQDNHVSALNYVGSDPTGADVLSVLERYRESGVKPIDLQQRVEGIEIGIGRYFNGNDWVGSIEMNVEHKHLCNGGIGPMTGEMGTLMWYDDDENNPLFCATIGKMKAHLTEAGFRGDVDINCIVNGEKLWPLEITTRFGCPSTQLQSEIHVSPWGEFLHAVAAGTPYELEYKRGYGIVVSVAVPPFPYISSDTRFSMEGTDILFKGDLTAEEMNRLHFEEVAIRRNGKEHYYIAGPNGYTLYVTGFGKTVEEARTQAYALIDKLIIPKMFYRTDIGEKFMNRDERRLREWGWIA